MALSQRTRVLAAGALGNVLEWYDFGLYGLLAPVLARQFFPARDALAALLGVYGGFAVGFAMRPIGAVVLGRVGDRQGRKRLLLLSVALMGAATLAIGLLPGYAAIGVWAPILLILIRLFQGFSVGGEYVGSVTYLVETAAPGRRGLAGSTANLGATVGMLLAAAVAALAVAPGWWRAAFWLGGALALAALLLRRSLPAEPQNEPRPRAGEPQWPALDALRRFPRLMLILLVLTCGYGIANYLIMVFLPTFGHQFAGIGEATALRINTAGQALALALVPLGGWLSDRWLRRRTLLAWAFLLQAALAWFLFHQVLERGAAGLWAAQLLLAGLLALVMGAAPAMLAEQFPHAYRVSGHALVLNVGVGIAGGTAPLLALALIAGSHSPLAGAWYLAAGSLAAALAACLLPDFSRGPLPEPSPPLAVSGGSGRT